MIKILDCTLRDGGYYTNWDFNKTLVNQYVQACNDLPIDYIEVGYRSPIQKDYFGKYFYLPLFELESLKSQSNKKLVVILNEKDVRVEHLEVLLTPILGLIDMVRIAIDPDNLHRAIQLAAEIKKYGLEIGFNVMYMSKWKNNSKFIEALDGVDDVADYFYMVDSYGGVFPEDIIELINLVKSKTSCRLGFHGHNNLELALVNTLTAIQYGVEIVDATILGMGRGAGNLKTELLLTVLNSKYNLAVDFNALESAVSAITPLLTKYEWGTNLPYMISGSNSLPQKDVMDWVSTRYYSFNSIVRALDNKKKKQDDNEKYPIANFESNSEVLIVGGGPSVSEHLDGLLALLSSKPEMVIIHASSKNAAYFRDLPNQQYFCLVGNEGRRLENTLENLSSFNGICVLPPYPRTMGTYVPDKVRDKTFELEKIDITDLFKDAHTALALQILKNVNATNAFIIGYDGYKDILITEKEKSLISENNYLFSLIQVRMENIFSFFPSYYNGFKVKSMYSLV
ncbi:aldolase catalytic domain-containing protein [Sphingobacterium multivorum]|uniref:aldolase catalytic domain-containing protein n=1 Tax=Sphingobacterium multivorum TaxID=28454 RepID=UPI0028A7A725|nr:aldolase catalytic domain-containing protein [Sphingobacterium multivorum]